MSSALEKGLQRRREDCRRDVLAWLAERHPLAFRIARICEHINRRNGTDYSEDEIHAALAFRIGLTPPEVEEIKDRSGTDHSYRATSAGQLNYERDEY